MSCGEGFDADERERPGVFCRQFDAFCIVMETAIPALDAGAQLIIRQGSDVGFISTQKSVAPSGLDRAAL